jgi:hypothetical protein
MTSIAPRIELRRLSFCSRLSRVNRYLSKISFSLSSLIYYHYILLLSTTFLTFFIFVFQNSSWDVALDAAIKHGDVHSRLSALAQEADIKKATRSELQFVLLVIIIMP